MNKGVIGHVDTVYHDNPERHVCVLGGVEFQLSANPFQIKRTMHVDLEFIVLTIAKIEGMFIHKTRHKGYYRSIN